MRREDYNRGGLDYENRERDYSRDRDFDREDYRSYEGRGSYGREFDGRGSDRSLNRDYDQNYMNRERRHNRDFDEDRGFGYGRSFGNPATRGYNEGNTGQNWGGRNYSESGYGGDNYRTYQPYQSLGSQTFGGGGSYGQNYPMSQQHSMGRFSGQHSPGQFSQQHNIGQGFYGHRNDDEIEREVYDRLDNEWQIPDNADIHVEVNDCVVTLTGQVRNRNAKMAAWNCVWQIPGVEDLHNNISIQSRRRQNQGSQGMGRSSGSSSGNSPMSSQASSSQSSQSTQSGQSGQSGQISSKMGQPDTTKK